MARPSKMAKTFRKKPRASQRPRTRKQQGGLQEQVLANFFNKERIEKALGISSCSTYITKGQYGSIMKACTSANGECRPPCFTIKYIPSETQNTEQKLSNEVLVHESHILYDITNASIKGGSTEIPYHIEQYIGSIIPQKTTPWLFAENIVGATLAAGGIPKEGANEAISYYLQVLLVLDDIAKVLPGFVHGDLNAGNIFLLPRPIKHKQCRYEMMSFTNEGDSITKEYIFSTKYMIKLIDFGFSEHNNFKWGNDHPAHPGRELAGMWELDAFMALNSLYSVSNEEQQTKFVNICTKFFGAELAAALDDPEFDIYTNLHLIEHVHSQKNEFFEYVNSLSN